jgi:L-ascorbate metabolism protein UlaG (beta-lactamase superfamily)
MQVHHIRSATLILAIGPHHLLVDPMLSPPGAMPGFKMFGGGRRPNPLVPLPAGSDALLDQVTGVLITHEHPDHLDAAGITFIAARKLPVWASPTDVPSLRRKGLDARELRTGALGLSVEHIPSRHGTGIVGWLMGPVAGFYLSYPGEPSVYLTSDSVLCEGVLEALARLRPELVIAPAGSANFGIGPSILFSLDELMTLIRKAPHAVLLNHLEALDHCPTTRQALRERLHAEGLSAKVSIPDDGETLSFSHKPAALHVAPGEGPRSVPRLQKWIASRLG